MPQMPNALLLVRIVCHLMMRITNPQGGCSSAPHLEENKDSLAALADSHIVVMGEIWYVNNYVPNLLQYMTRLAWSL